MNDTTPLSELQERVDNIESTLYDVRCRWLRLANAVAAFAPSRTEFFGALHHDTFQPTSNDCQIRSLLVERVRNAIASEYEPADYCWDEARAAIREVAAWIKCKGVTQVPTLLELLEQEAER